jgi:hypothetical protein
MDPDDKVKIIRSILKNYDDARAAYKAMAEKSRAGMLLTEQPEYTRLSLAKRLLATISVPE